MIVVGSQAGVPGDGDGDIPIAGIDLPEYRSGRCYCFLYYYPRSTNLVSP